MRLVPLTTIEVRKRQRSQIAAGPLGELQASILGRGLLHPPVCWYDPLTARWILTAGERRLSAIQRINELKPVPTFMCGETEVEPGLIPVTPLGDYLDELGRFEAELDENLQRADLDWKDRTRALASLHEMRLLLNPQQTLADTGRELADKGVVKTTKEGPARGYAGLNRVREAQIIVAHLENEQVASARSTEEALNHIYRQQEERALAALVRRQMADFTAKPTLDVRQGDLTIVLPSLTAGTFDLVLADPPYGLGAHEPGYRARTVHHHNYEDTPDEARKIALAILTEGFRLTKPRANIFVFCDIDLFDWLKRTASNMGWVPFRRPLIWIKSESEGMAPWGGSGPRITTEFIFYATKGQRGLISAPTDVFIAKRVSRTERLHAAEKPVDLLKELIKYSTLPGDSVLDPCCGSGSTLVACRELKRRALGIEIDETYYNTALANLSEKV